MTPPSLILASSSPHRKKLLTDIGLSFSSQSPELDERSVQKAFNGELKDLAGHLSFKKAESVLTHHPKSCVIGSDQVMVFKGQSFPKPETLEEVTSRLKALRGNSHELHTGLCVLWKDKKFQTTVVTRLSMYNLSDTEIKTYVEEVQPIGCAGGYKIENKGALLFSEIQSPDHYSIIGLPLLSLVSILRDWGIFRLL